MAELRCQLRQDFDGAAAQARELVDWKYYVKQAPWAALGVAAIAAFVAVPRKLKVTTVDSDAAVKLAQQDGIVVDSMPEATAKGGLGGFLLRTAMAMAVRTAMGVATQKAAGYGSAKNSPTPESQPT